jgi:selenocysteine-specific elongation factor
VAALAVLVDESAEAGVSADSANGAGVDRIEARDALGVLAAAGRAELLTGGGGERWFAAGVLDRARKALTAVAAAGAASRPERPFSAVAELVAAVPGLSPDVATTLLDGLVAAGRMLAAEGGYAPAGSPGVLTPAQEAAAGDLRGRLEAEPFAPPTLATLAEDTGMPAKDLARLLETLARRGDLVRVDKDLWFAVDAVTVARERLEAALAAGGQVSLAGFRDLLGCGRRNAQALLELFDREGLTRRQGDVRVARRRRQA